MNTEQITVVDNQIVDNTVVDNTVVLQGGVIGERSSPKKKPVLKAIPKKIMGYLKFAHFVLTTANNDDTILTKLFLDKSIEQIVSIVNDVVENGTQDKDINDLRKQLINSAKPKKTRVQKVKKTDHADAIVTDLVTLARTETESSIVEPIVQSTVKPKKTRTKKNILPPPIVESTTESIVEPIVESIVQTTPVEPIVESIVQTTPVVVESIVESIVQTNPVVVEPTAKPKNARTKKSKNISELPQADPIPRANKPKSKPKT